MRGTLGFTAVELLVTIAILAVLSTLAAPSMTSLIESWRVRQAAEDLQSSLYLARSEAIKHGGDVTLTADSNWSSGWKITTTVNGSSEVRQNTPAPTRTTITLDTGKTVVDADRWGILESDKKNEFVFTLYPSTADASSTATRLLCISAGGRILNVRKSLGCS